MKNKNINMLIVALLLLVLLSIMLTVFLWDAHERFPKEITVVEDGVTESILPIRDLRLTPTQSKEYTVNLICAATGSYYIYLDYEEESDGGMKPFVDVEIRLEGELVYQGALVTLLDPDEPPIALEGELHETEPLELSITYTMPRNVGNEAQATFANFDIHLKIKKS